MSLATARRQLTDAFIPLDQQLAELHHRLTTLRRQEGVLWRRYLATEAQFDASHDPAEKAGLNREQMLAALDAASGRRRRRAS